MPKINSINPLSEWDFNGEKMYSFTVTLDNNLTGKVNTKSPDRWSVGDEVDATTYKDKQGNDCLKLSKPDQGFSGGKGGKKMDATTEKRITFLSCLSSASTFANGSGATAEQVIELAKKFTAAAYDYSKPAPAAKPVPQGMQQPPMEAYQASDDDLPF